jgi:hypothetical protein
MMIKLTGAMAILALVLLLGVGVVAGVDPARVDPRVDLGVQPPAPPPAPAQQRLSWQAFAQDPARVQSLMRGVAKMKSRDTAARNSVDYRKSWQYWAAMHSYYGPQSRQGGPIQQAINATPPQFRSFFNGLTDLTPPTKPAGLAATVWDACQHGTVQFFAWHRLFLYYFERVLREAAGDQTLRLPYWDYTNPQQVDFPTAFGTPNDSNGQPNPLFDARRTAQNVQLDPVDTDIDDALTLPDFNDFQSEIEGGIHGLVHCAMGNGCASPLMGRVPAAAVDPIFWLHHANIDRIWQCWLEDGGQVPGGSWKTKSFTFVTDTGAKTTIRVGKLFDPNGPIDYTYDHATACARGPAPPAPHAAPTAMTSRQPQPPSPASTIAIKSDVPIGDALTTVALGVTPVSGASRDLLTRMMSPDTPGVLELVLDGISAEAAPGVLFRVYLARKSAPDKREYLGTINFFGLTDHAAHERGGGHRRFIVTKAMRALAGAGAGTATPPDLADFNVVFEATLGRANTNVEAARAQFNNKAGIKIQSMQLRVLP